MKDLAKTVLARNKAELESPVPIVYVVEFTVPTTPRATMMRLTNNTQDVPIGKNPVSGLDILAQHFPMAHGEIPANKVGDLRDFDVQLHDAAGEILAFCAKYDWLTGQRIAITYLPIGVARQEAARIVHEGKIVHFAYEQEVLTFSIGHANISRAVFPPRRVDSVHCGVGKFGNKRCGYDIPDSPGGTIGTGFPDCSRVLEACIERGLDEAARGVTVNHPLNFDAYPGAAQSST